MRLVVLLLFSLLFASSKSDPIPAFSTSSVCICRCCTQGICEPVWNITYNVNSCDSCTITKCAEQYTQCSTRSQIVANCARKNLYFFNGFFIVLLLKERSSTFSISSISVFLICIFGLGVIAVFKNYVRRKSFVNNTI